MNFTNRITTGRVIEVLNSKYDATYTKDEGDDYFHTKPVNKINLDLGGIINERNYGFSMLSNSRTKSMYEKGTSIRNNAQWTAIGVDELQRIQKNMNIKVDEIAQYIGIHIVIDGIENFSMTPRGYYLVFGSSEKYIPKHPENVVLINHGGINPCVIAGRGVEVGSNISDIATKFPKAAMYRRGLRGWVEKGGGIKKGDYVHILEPTGRT